MRALIILLALTIGAWAQQPTSSIDQVQLQLSGMMHDLESGIWQLSNKVRLLEQENAKLKAELEAKKEEKKDAK